MGFVIAGCLLLLEGLSREGNLDTTKFVLYSQRSGQNQYLTNGSDKRLFSDWHILFSLLFLLLVVMVIT